MSLHKKNGWSDWCHTSPSFFVKVCLVSMCCPASAESPDQSHQTTPNFNANLNPLILSEEKKKLTPTLLPERRAVLSSHYSCFSVQPAGSLISPPTPNPLGLPRLWWVFPLSQVSDFILHGGCDLLQPVAKLHFLGRGVLLQRRDDLRRGHRDGWRER